MKGRILIVDDSTQSLAGMAVLVLNEGHSVVTARSFTEALSLAAGCFPNLVISEMLMPQMRITEFIEKIRQIDPSHPIPFALMSARTNVGAEKTAAELGASAYLEKPVDHPAVRRTLEGVLKKARLEAMRMHNNQRRHERVPFSCDAYFESEDVSGFGVVSDLSKGGLFLASSYPIRPGTIIKVSMKLLPGMDVEVFGEVRYIGRKDMRKGVGIKFLRMDPTAMQIVERIIKESLKVKSETTPV